MTDLYHEYLDSAEWHQKSKFFRSVMLNRDCVFPFLPSQDAHHMTYRNLTEEIFLRDAVPLNKTFHLNYLHPFMRLWHKKRDIPFLRFWVNWLILRPSCAFWFVWLTAIAIVTKTFGWKPVAIMLGIIGTISILLTLKPNRFAWMHWVLSYACLVGYSVINKSRN